MSVVAVAFAGIAYVSRRKQPMGYVIDPDGLVVVRRSGQRLVRRRAERRGAAALRRRRSAPAGHGRRLRLPGRFRLSPEGWVSAQRDVRAPAPIDVGSSRVLVSPGDDAAFIAAAGGADA